MNYVLQQIKNFTVKPNLNEEHKIERASSQGNYNAARASNQNEIDADMNIEHSRSMDHPMEHTQTTVFGKQSPNNILHSSDYIQSMECVEF